MQATQASPSTAPAECPNTLDFDTWRKWYLEGWHMAIQYKDYYTNQTPEKRAESYSARLGLEKPKTSFCACCGATGIVNGSANGYRNAKRIYLGEKMDPNAVLEAAGLICDGKVQIGTHTFTDDDGLQYSFAWRDE